MATSNHASLSASFKIDYLKPQEIMEPYVPCWCLSGKKWKFCHKERALAQSLEFGELIAGIRSEFQVGYCSHPLASHETCGDVIIKAHTVQKSGGLYAISEKGHVLSFKAGMDNIEKNKGKIIPKLTGLKVASTFNGFCNTHDSSMFKPVEVGQPILSDENVFLLSFRALAYELFMKRAALKGLEKERTCIDNGREFKLQAFLQHVLYTKLQGHERGISHMESLKAQYDQAYRSNDYTSHSFYAIEFSGVLPVTASGAFHPEVDFEGNQLQKISRGNNFEHVAFNLTTLNGLSVAAFGWIGEDDGPASLFIHSLQRIPDEDKASAIIQLAFEYLENIYLKPSWWESLPEEESEFLIEKTTLGIGLNVRGSESLLNRPYAFSLASVTKIFEQM